MCICVNKSTNIHSLNAEKNIYINEAFTYIMHKYFPIFFFMFPGYKYAVCHNASFYFSDICGACLPGLSFYVVHM